MKINNTEVHVISITDEMEGQRIDNFLRARLKGVPKSMVYRILRTGKVRVNKKRIKANYKLTTGDLVRIPPIRIAKRSALNISAKMDKVLELKKYILYEDNCLLILNKPSGIVVHGGSGLIFGVIEGLRALQKTDHFLELVHRLDRGTSGVLLIAKTYSALRSMHEQLRTKEMQKDYLALVRGQWPSSCQEVLAPLLKNIQYKRRRIMCVNSEGKPSITRFKVEERYGCATLIKASPITGRTHQIRVHAMHIGHPIAFDNRYGDCIFDRQMLTTGLKRLFLHAIAVRFKHPETGKEMHIEAQIDGSLSQCLQSLRHQKFKHSY